MPTGADLNPRLVELIRGFEAMKLEAYKCKGGAWTISAGVTRYEDGSPVKPGDKVTIERARELYLHTLAQFRGEVAKLLPAATPEHVIDACTSCAYNIGLEAFEGSTFRKRLLDGDIKGAAEAIRWWNKATDESTGNLVVLGGLVARREAEADLLVNGWDGTSGPAIVKVEEAPPRVLESRTIWGAILGSSGLIIGFLAENGTALLHDVDSIDSSSWTQLGFGLLGFSITTYARFRDWRNGRR